MINVSKIVQLYPIFRSTNGGLVFILYECYNWRFYPLKKKYQQIIFFNGIIFVSLKNP